MNKTVVASTLKHLSNAQGYYTPETTLHVLVNADVPGFLPVDTLRGELHQMKAKGWIDYEVDDYGCEKWRITERGRIQLKEVGA